MTVEHTCSQAPWQPLVQIGDIGADQLADVSSRVSYARSLTAAAQH